MNHRGIACATGFAVAALIVLAAFGCTKTVHNFIPNERPTVTLTSAPIDTRDTAFYAYKINWSGYDNDGRIDHYMYVIDPSPTSTDTTWTLTTKNEETKFFRSANPVFPADVRNPVRGVDFHTFIIKSVDNLGMVSASASRVFYSYTVAPTVTITSPRPSATSTAAVTPAMRITWTGVDPDGQTRQKPVKYKFKLLPKGNTEFDIVYAITASGQDSLRRFFAATNFAGWDSVGGDTTTVQYTGLTPNQTYLFVLIGIDEAGAYNANFSTDTNMLTFQVGYAGTLGPKITVFNTFFFYGMPTGGFAPNNPAAWQHLEVPSATTLTFNWFATPPEGADMEWYRWRLGGDVDDETPRTNETTDTFHWSQRSLSTTSCTIGPFNTPEERTLYVEAEDNNGMLSILVIKLLPIIPTLNTPSGRELLIVDDTRMEVDQFTQVRADGSGNPLFRKNYGGTYPARAELDTLLFAKGGFPWRATSGNVAATSTPGLFAGYTYDTLGTRQGYFNASVGVAFSRLSQYRHMIWMVDHGGAYNTSSSTNALSPMSALHYMNTPGHNNTFSTYTFAGGRMWLLGGGAEVASMREFNAIGPDNNDRDYAPINGFVFAGTGYAHHAGKEELQPGRLMYDAAKWQSLTMSQVATARVNRSTSVTTNLNRRWLAQPGFNFSNPVTRPDYTLLPATMHLHTNPATDPVSGEPIPPTRPSTYSGSWWSTSLAVDVEYLMQPNYIIEDMNPDAVSESLQVGLDTLMSVQGSGIVSAGQGYEPASMTWYHGVASPEFVFTGFPIWVWRRSDCQQLVDFVMQQIWHLPKSTTPAMAASRQFANPFSRPAPTTAPATGRFQLPAWRSGGK